jgi:hypothetical protein
MDLTVGFKHGILAIGDMVKEDLIDIVRMSHPYRHVDKDFQCTSLCRVRRRIQCMFDSIRWIGEEVDFIQVGEVTEVVHKSRNGSCHR